MFKLTVDVAEDGPTVVEIEKNAGLLSKKLGCLVAVRFPVANGNTLNAIHNGKNSAEFLNEWSRMTCASNFTKNGILSCSSLYCKYRAACRRGQGLTASGVTTIETIEGIMRLYNAARRNRDKGGKRKELFAGRCEGIAMTLAKLGYSIGQEKGEA